LKSDVEKKLIQLENAINSIAWITLL
jgi:hypothetical protein